VNLNEAFEYLQFWINKKTGSWYTIPELELLTDRGQMSYYSDLKPQYAKSQLVKEILSPFKREYQFTPSNTVSGYIVIPSNSNYLDLLDIQIEFLISSTTVYAGVAIVNEDERAIRLNSQIDPVTATSPIAEIIVPRYIKMWPQTGYTGTITYLRRPAKPVFGYSLVSERVVVYNSATSTELEWRETEQNAVLLKCLSSAGINLSDEEIQNYSEIKTQSNWIGQNRI
jgi:hypothetical protein